MTVTELTPDVAPVRPLADLAGSDLEVPLVGGARVRYANLDLAATAPALRPVAERVAQLVPYLGSVHRGAGLPSQWSTALYEEARASVGRSFGARDEDVVVFTRGTTDALNLLAAAVPAGREVIFLDVEHHANLLPWQARGHRCLAHAATLAETLERLSEALAAARAPALVAITGASNVTGERPPLDAVVALAHAAGARVAVDAAQLAPHGRIDLGSSGVDYVACSGHKLYAPYGAGALVGRRDWLDAAAPYLAGGGAVHDVAPERVAWAAAPQRHEAGTPNLLGAVGLATALEALDSLGAERASHEEALRRRLVGALAAIEGVERPAIWSDGADPIGVVCFTVAGWDPALVAAVLSAEHGIGVRDGRFCAHPLLRRLGLPGGAVRASLGVGSVREDVDRLAGALEALTCDGPRHAYVREGAGWRPVNDDREAPAAIGMSSAPRLGAAPCGGGARLAA
jgi:selenocysteine lyase/cysteine desulfurase